MRLKTYTYCTYFIVLSFCIGCSTHDTHKKTLTILSPHPPEIKREFGKAFEHWMQTEKKQGVSVAWLDVGGTGEAIEYVKSRAAAHAQGIDVFFGGGDAPFLKLSKLKLLKAVTYTDTTLFRFPPYLGTMPLYAAHHEWYGAALSSFGIMYNKRICSQRNLPIPQKWIDLASNRYKNSVACADPRYSGTIHIMFEVILQSYGWEKGWDILCSIAGNIPVFSRSASLVVKDVALGEAAVGMAIDFYAATEIERYGNENIGFRLPANETIVSPDGIGILTTSSDTVLAKDFVTFVLTQGQKLWIYKKGIPGGPTENALCRFPVDTTLYAMPDSLKSAVGNPYTTSSSFVYKSSLSSKRWDLVNDLICAIIIAPHANLKASAAKHHSTFDSDTHTFRPPITEGAADSLCATWGVKNNAANRIRTIDIWTRTFLQSLQATQ